MAIAKNNKVEVTTRADQVVVVVIAAKNKIADAKVLDYNRKNEARERENDRHAVKEKNTIIAIGNMSCLRSQIATSRYGNVHFTHITFVLNLLFANCFACAKMLLLA